MKHVISKLAEMRYLMGTNKPLTDMINGTDAEIWNSQLDTYRNEVCCEKNIFPKIAERCFCDYFNFLQFKAICVCGKF